MNAQQQDRGPLEMIRDFTLDHRHPQVDNFKPAMCGGTQWHSGDLRQTSSVK